MSATQRQHSQKPRHYAVRELATSTLARHTQPRHGGRQACTASKQAGTGTARRQPQAKCTTPRSSQQVVTASHSPVVGCLVSAAPCRQLGTSAVAHVDLRQTHVQELVAACQHAALRDWRAELGQDAGSGGVPVRWGGRQGKRGKEGSASTLTGLGTTLSNAVAPAPTQTPAPAPTQRQHQR